MIEKAHKFLDKIFAHLDEAGIELGAWPIDHLCYRTSSLDNYEEMKRVFQGHGECLIESQVNGRQIATYKLFEPVVYNAFVIPLLEVPAPKPGRKLDEGFEHIEVVIDISFEELMKKLPHLEFNTKALSKELNPELVYKFKDCAIKFHHLPLDEVIEIEKRGL